MRKIPSSKFYSYNYQKRRIALSFYLLDYLALHGIDTDVGCVINCLNPRHDDRHPSMSVYKCAKKDNAPCLYCYACEFKADLYDIIGLVEGIPDFKSQYHRAIELFVEKGA